MRCRAGMRGNQFGRCGTIQSSAVGSRECLGQGRATVSGWSADEVGGLNSLGTIPQGQPAVVAGTPPPIPAPDSGVACSE